MAFADGQSSVAQPISLFTLPTRKHTAKVFVFVVVFILIFYAFACRIVLKGIDVGFLLPLWLLSLLVCFCGGGKLCCKAFGSIFGRMKT